jgi:hypothetical protein
VSRIEQLIGHGVCELFPHDPAQLNHESARSLRESCELVLRAASKRDRVHHVSRHEGAGWSATYTQLLVGAGQVASTAMQPGEMLEYMQCPESVPAEARNS